MSLILLGYSHPPNHFSTGQYVLQLLSEGSKGLLIDESIAFPVVPESVAEWNPSTSEYQEMMAAFAFRFIERSW